MGGASGDDVPSALLQLEAEVEDAAGAQLGNGGMDSSGKCRSLGEVLVTVDQQARRGARASGSVVEGEGDQDSGKVRDRDTNGLRERKGGVREGGCGQT
jgi:hypothetical protein